MAAMSNLQLGEQHQQHVAASRGELQERPTALVLNQRDMLHTDLLEKMQRAYDIGSCLLEVCCLRDDEQNDKHKAKLAAIP